MRPTLLRSPRSGFTLAEMAIVVLLVGIAMTLGLRMMSANLDNAAYAETKTKQEAIKTALIAFLRSNGRLPCPDNDLTAPPTGVEAATGCSGAAQDGQGVLPWQTLGLPRGAVLDGWGNFFTYRVSNQDVSGTPGTSAATPLHNNPNQNWTVKTGFDIDSFKSAPPYAAGFVSLTVQSRDSAFTAYELTRTAIVVVISHGKNGFGARTTKTKDPIPGSGADEALNSDPLNILVSMSRSYTEDTGATGGAFDDLVVYMTPQDLLQPLFSEKTLYTCSAYCDPTGVPPPGPGCTATLPIPIGNPVLTYPPSPTCP